ncbi:MAG TPA: hypothetical protein VGA80_06740 [Flavobacteriaceae bacterium]
MTQIYLFDLVDLLKVMRNSKITYEGKKVNVAPKKVLVKMNRLEEVTKSGIILPNLNGVKLDFKGEIVAVSPVMQDMGFPEIGVTVILPKTSGVVVPTDDDKNEYRLYLLDDIRYVH